MFQTAVKFALLFVTTILLASCSGASMLRAILPAPSQEEIAAARISIAPYCEEKSGARVFRTAENVDGFVYRSSVNYGNGLQNPPTEEWGSGCSYWCLKNLLNGFSYVEAELQIAPTRRENRFNFVGAPAGFYRYEFAKRSGDNCARFDQMAKTNDALQSAIRSYPEILEDQCVVGRPISSFEAKYQFEGYRVVRERHSHGTYIQEYGNQIVDRTNGNVLANNSNLIVRNSKYGRTVLASCDLNQNTDIAPIDVLVPRN